jgi:hypothetical protein
MGRDTIDPLVDLSGLNEPVPSQLPPGTPRKKATYSFIRTCIHHISDYNPCQTQIAQAGVAVTPSSNGW